MRTLDELETTAKLADESFHGDEPRWYNGGWDEESVSPREVLRLIARIRELEAGLLEACDIACVQMTQEDYRRMGELERLAKP
jgi:hypothetical protein